MRLVLMNRTIILEILNLKNKGLVVNSYIFLCYLTIKNYGHTE